MVFVLINVTCSLFSQNSKIDSLKKILRSDKEDTIKTKHLDVLARELDVAGDFENAVAYCNLEKQLSISLNFKKGIANAFNTLGNINYHQGNYPEALQNHFSSLEIQEQRSNKKGVASSLGNIAAVYCKQGDYSKALQYNMRMLKIVRELNNKNLLSGVIGNIGNVYKLQGNLDKAMDYYLMALKLNEELNNKNNSAAWLGNIGALYYEKAVYLKANSLERDSLFKKVIDYYFRYLKMAEELQNLNYMTIAYGNIGKLYYDVPELAAPPGEKRKGLELAEFYLQKALTLSREMKAFDVIKDQEQFLSELYTKKGDWKQAKEHYIKYIEAKDFIFSEDNKKKSMRTEMDYEFEKKKAVVAAEQEKKDAVSRAERDKEKQNRKIILAAVLCGLFLVLVFSAFVLRGFRQKKKINELIKLQKKEVERQKEMVEQKQKEILDSIRYAKRIQSALLTSEKYISRNLTRLG